MYVLTKLQAVNGTVWPRSQFQKVDVLQHCLTEPVLQSEIVQEPATTLLLDLPPEIVERIFATLHAWGKLRAYHLRVCKLFYIIALPILYQNPKLKATNFFAFVETISSRKQLGGCIKHMDLSYIIQTGKNAFVAKLLKYSRASLQLFVAPQTSFGFGPLMSLKHCKRLKVLDLRLVSETLNLEELFESIRHLDDLVHLSFPRSSMEITKFENIAWPSRLSFLRISGGISDEFLQRARLPQTITHLEFSHCPSITEYGFHYVISQLGSNLRLLKVQYPMPKFNEGTLDRVFIFCPNLLVLELSVDYVSRTIFEDDNLVYLPYKRPLRTLYIDCSGMLGTSTRLDPIDLAIAIDEDRLPMLKNMSCTAKLGWNPLSRYVSQIIDELDNRGGGLYIGY